MPPYYGRRPGHRRDLSRFTIDPLHGPTSGESKTRQVPPPHTPKRCSACAREEMKGDDR